MPTKKHKRAIKDRNDDFTCHPNSIKTKLFTITQQNQQKSPLLQLPGELRNIIYALVLGGHTIPDQKPNLALLATCCQIYYETRLLPFELNTVQICRDTQVRSFVRNIHFFGLEHLKRNVTRLHFRHGKAVKSHCCSDGSTRSEYPHWYSRHLSDWFRPDSLPSLKSLKITLDFGFCTCGTGFGNLSEQDVRDAEVKEATMVAKNWERKAKRENKELKVDVEIGRIYDHEGCDYTVGTRGSY
ncbi:hypothetical protein P280DRAFT_473210 [Massarina eburnea CBS 473.64]|uniref:Uncharacterized protein n=1 Tax=Massarina eburnea CBS 473.64 TaxID=1395130 RepID=A0A6A6RLX4_9PLEO|nr:hypothetical protein P280DRAFT_473210 [Massarina eburnea CBS 473.64]